MSEYIAKNMLVTGSAGFIGCNFVRYILKNHPEIKIISLDKLTYAGNMENLPNAKQHLLIEGDICDRQLVMQLLHHHHIDTIAHFAAESHVDRSICGPNDFIQTNIVGTFILLDAVRQYWLEEKKLSSSQCRFHHVSTDEVYGDLGPNDPAFTEETPYAPSSPYSASKASSDHLVRAYCRTYGLPVTISNCSNNYGPYQHEEKLIPTVIRCCIAQRSIPIYGNGSNVRDWLYVDDHCEAIDLILRKGRTGETYNVGGNNEMSNLQLVNAICLLMDQKMPINGSHSDLISFVEDRPGHDRRYAVSNNKIRNELGWDSRHRFTDAIDLTVDYYLA